jgi:methyl-accepting chemotaxis protein
MNRIGFNIAKSRRRRIRPVAGVRRKIRVGFILLGGLLLFSGLISVFEFSQLSRTTDELLDISVRDLELSRTMFEALDRQNTALQEGGTQTDSLLRLGEADFNRAFGEARQRNIYPARLERIAEAKTTYDNALAQHRADTADTRYRLAWYDLALHIKDLMIDSQNTVDQNTTGVQANAYRAMMPGIITLAFAILIIFIFYILIDLYYIRPVLKVGQGLGNYLNQKIPYRVQVDARDEIKELSDDISTLVALLRKKENERAGIG